MTDSVHCSLVNDKVAQAEKKERALLNTTADLSKSYTSTFTCAT